jgi:hypothetical protein
MGKEVRRYERPDGKQIVRLVELEPGLYSFTEENELWEEAHPAIGEGHAYWSGEGRGDGLYDSLRTAERELVLKFPWIART